MYLEFLLPILDYFKTLSVKIILFEWVVPLSIAFTTSLFITSQEAIGFVESSIGVLGVLIALAMMIITIFLTSNHTSLNEIKNRKTKIRIGNQKISLFRLTLINLVYSVIVESFTIVFCLIAPIILTKMNMSWGFKYIGFALFLATCIHLILLNVRNLVDFYFIMSRDS